MRKERSDTKCVKNWDFFSAKSVHPSIHPSGVDVTVERPHMEEGRKEKGLE